MSLVPAHVLHYFHGFTVTYQALSTFFARVPYWIIVNLPKRWRPRPSWSLKRCVMVRLNLQLHYPRPILALIVIQVSMWKHFVYVTDR